MLSAIGSSTLASHAGTGKSTAGLEAQLDQYKRKLADWVNCPSCKTAEGKARITEISDKISAIRQRLEAADASKRSSRPSVTADAGIPTDKNKDKIGSASSVNDHIGDGSFPASPRQAGAVGSRLDVFA